MVLHNISEVNIMHMQIDINTKIEINTLEDLPKLNLLMESCNMKVNKSQLARDLNVDRRTIDKYLKGYVSSKTRKRKSKIDEYYGIIKLLLSDETPQKFYYKRVLWQYLKDNHDLDCSDVTFRAYISRKPEFQEYFDKRKGRTPNRETVRFETAPAEQAQLDWKEDIRYITKDGEILSVNVFVFLLGYSRFRTYSLSISKSQSILLSFLTESFEAIGGIPKTILVDNMKTIMDESRTAHQPGVVNERFYQFSKDFGFDVQPCVAYSPRTKGKVEAPMKILDEIHAYQGKFTYEELHQFIQELCDRVNHEYHKGTGKIPVLHFKQERDLLSPLPNRNIRDLYKIDHTLVKVNTSNMFSFKSNMYSVPSGYIGKTVGLQVYDNKIHVYYNTDLIVVHPISEQKMNFKHEHYVETLSNHLPYKDDIDELALKNLSAINEVYKNE